MSGGAKRAVAGALCAARRAGGAACVMRGSGDEDSSCDLRCFRGLSSLNAVAAPDDDFVTFVVSLLSFTSWFLLTWLISLHSLTSSLWLIIKKK